MSIRIYMVTWHSTVAPANARTMAIAADRDLSEEELKAEIAQRSGLSISNAVMLCFVNTL